MLKVRHTLGDLVEAGLLNVAPSPCFRTCCTVSYRDLNIVPCPDTPCHKGKTHSASFKGI